MSSAVKKELTTTLSNGVSVPLLGIGTYSPNGANSDAMVCALKECGIRHIDTATMYKTEHLVGKSIKDSGVPRKELFITSKVWPTQFGSEGLRKTLRKSLKELDVDYIDLYLLHCPMCPGNVENPTQLLAETWKALEECYHEGLCKAIGVSNFEEHHLNDLKETWTVAPHMNQIEIHVHCYPKKLISFCTDLGIKITGYCPLAQGKALKNPDPDIIKFAEERKCTVSQVLINWSIQHGFVTIPKSAKVGRVRENSKILEQALTAQEMKILDAISEHSPICISNFTVEVIEKLGASLPQD